MSSDRPGQWDNVANMPRDGEQFVVELDNDIINHNISWWGRNRIIFARYDEKGALYTVVTGSVVDIPIKYIIRALELPA